MTDNHTTKNEYRQSLIDDAERLAKAIREFREEAKTLQHQHDIVMASLATYDRGWADAEAARPAHNEKSSQTAFQAAIAQTSDPGRRERLTHETKAKRGPKHPVAARVLEYLRKAGDHMHHDDIVSEVRRDYGIPEASITAYLYKAVREGKIARDNYKQYWIVGEETANAGEFDEDEQLAATPEIPPAEPAFKPREETLAFIRGAGDMGVGERQLAKHDPKIVDELINDGLVVIEDEPDGHRYYATSMETAS